MGVISPKSWTLTSSVPFNRLKCNHFDLCQNRGEDLGFDPPSPRLLREFYEIFLGAICCGPVTAVLGIPQKNPSPRGITLDVYKVDPWTTSFLQVQLWGLFGAENSINLTRMDGYGLGFIFGFPPWTSSNLSLSEMVSNDKKTITVWDQVQISLQESS